MHRLILAIPLIVLAWGSARAIEVCEAVVQDGLLTTVRSIPETKTKTVTATRMVEVGGRLVPEEVTEETTVMEMVPVLLEESLESYRVSNASGDEVGARTVREALSKKRWIVVLTDELPVSKRAIFRPDTLFFESKSQLIREALERLEPREAEILRLRYATEETGPLTDDEIAGFLKMTPDALRADIRRIEEKLGFTLPPPGRS